MASAQDMAGVGHEKLPAWPWDSRGREVVTADDVRRELTELRALVSSRMHSTASGGNPSVQISGEGWR